MKLLSNFKQGVREKLQNNGDHGIKEALNDSSYCLGAFFISFFIGFFLFLETVNSFDSLTTLEIIFRVVCVDITCLCSVLLFQMADDIKKEVIEFLITKNAEKQQNDPLKTKDGQGIAQKD